MKSLSKDLNDNIRLLNKLLPIKASFDFMYRNLYLGETEAYWLGINGFCRTEILQRLFSDLQDPFFVEDSRIEQLPKYINSKIGYAQITLTSSWDDILRNVLSGPSVLFIDGFNQAILIDVRSYPTRSIAEPDAEKVTRGARDGFVETLLFNANLIRRRIRSPHLTFSMHNIGSESRTDVAVCYLNNNVDSKLLTKINQTLEQLAVTTLTMGSKSLEELLIEKKWWHPLPSIQMTERPDVACSYLSEGHILIIVDNSPLVLVLPCTVFQFMQSPEDYYKGPLIGGYFRLSRLLCLPINLLLMPVFLLITAYHPDLSAKWHLLSSGNMTPARILFYIIIVEFLLDLFKYSASLSSSRFTGALSIVGGLLIGDIAVSLQWASTEIFFYAAITLLASVSIPSIDLSDALRVYRIFLILITGIGGIFGNIGGTVGFFIGLTLVLFSVITTPTFGGLSYFWPLFPFNGTALKTLLFRYPTAKAQPCKVWHRNK